MKTKSAPAPAAPDPYRTSAANQQGNVNTAIAQTHLSNANEVNPFGSVKYDISGYEQVKDARGKVIDVPTFTKTTTLSDDEQRKYDLENQLAFQAGDIANNQLTQLETALNEPVNYDGLQEVEADPGYYRDLLYERLNPQIERDRSALDVKLANQGIAPGTEAYKRAIEQSERNVTDSRISAELAAGQYANQELSRDLQLRNQGIQERSALRSQPINEISALMSQSQVNAPQFQAFNPGTIQPTSVGNNINNAYAQNLQNYQLAQNQQNAKMGGLFGLGGSIIGGPIGGAIGNTVGGFF